MHHVSEVWLALIVRELQAAMTLLSAGVTDAPLKMLSRVVRAQEQMSLVSADGLPYLAPELVLLFKSRNTSAKDRGKDHADFRNVVAHLDPEQRAWLRWALVATAPDHSWLKQL